MTVNRLDTLVDTFQRSPHKKNRIKKRRFHIKLRIGSQVKIRITSNHSEKIQTKSHKKI